MKRVYIGNKELTALATVTNGGGGGDYTQKWVDYINGTLTEFTVPEGVTKIRDYAFYNCTSLTNIIISDSVTSIGNYAFYSCTSLTGITIGNGVTEIVGVTFFCCTSLTSITLPANVTSIGSYAFYGCTSLASVTIENSTSKLAYSNNLFSGIASTAKLYVPSNLLADYQADSDWTGAFKGGIFAIQ